jgi:hypothetical protein
LQLTGTSKLWKTVLILKENIDKYIEQLIMAAGENNLDCSEYIDRLERLNLCSQNTEVNKFIDTALLTLKSAAGFYHRLIYHQNYSNLQYQSCKSFQGRALEKQLAKINGNKVEIEIFDLIDELLKMEVKTGQEQQTFIEKLSYLFTSDSRFFKKLQTNIEEIFPSKGYPYTYDIKRDLYRYELQDNEKKGQSVVVEFNIEPADVAFIFTSQENLKSIESLIPLKQQSEKENANKNRYRLLSNMEEYLFMAAPSKIIEKVELIKI